MVKACRDLADAGQTIVLVEQNLAATLALAKPRLHHQQRAHRARRAGAGDQGAAANIAPAPWLLGAAYSKKRPALGRCERPRRSGCCGERQHQKRNADIFCGLRYVRELVGKSNQPEQARNGNKRIFHRRDRRALSQELQHDAPLRRTPGPRHYELQCNIVYCVAKWQTGYALN